MSKIKGVYAASMSVINKDLTLDVKKTIEHAEMVIDQGCHGTAIFGSTGQAQLIPVSEKINLLNQLSVSKYKEKYLIGTVRARVFLNPGETSLFRTLIG